MGINKGLFFVLLVAFFIRLIALNQSLWLDEAVTAKVVMSYDYSEIINKFSPTDFHPPLYYLFMKAWTNIFGYSEIALRMPSVLFCLMSGYFIYLISGIWAATFFLLNPLVIYYSQDARMYMMATFFLTAGTYLFLKYKKYKPKEIFLMSLFFSLAFLTFYGSIFFIATIFLYFLYKKQYKIFFVSGLLFLTSFLLIGPLLLGQFANSKIALSGVANWSATLGKANIKNLLLIPIKFSIGRISFYPKLAYWIISGIWTIWVFKKILIGGLKDKKLLYLFVFPLTLGFLISFFVPMLQYFRFIYLIPVMCLLLSRSSQRGWILTIGFLIFTLTYLLNPAFHREDWKGLVKDLPKNKPVYMIMSSSDPVRYYSKNINIKDISGKPIEKDITVIPFSFGVHGLDYKSLLGKQGYQLKKEKSFREVTYEQWSLK